MDIKEAKRIVKAIISWQFVLQGVTTRHDLEVDKTLDLKKYGLEDLIKANKMVINSNSHGQRLQEYHQSKGHNTKGRFVQMTISDRMLAGVFCLLHYDALTEVQILINDKGLGVVNMQYEIENDD